MHNLTYLIPYNTYNKLKTANAQYNKSVNEYNTFLQSVGFSQLSYDDFIKKFKELTEDERKLFMEKELEFRQQSGALVALILKEVNEYVSNN